MGDVSEFENGRCVHPALHPLIPECRMGLRIILVAAVREPELKDIPGVIGVFSIHAILRNSTDSHHTT
jgi:hypothetical protein